MQTNEACLTFETVGTIFPLFRIPSMNRPNTFFLLEPIIREKGAVK